MRRSLQLTGEIEPPVIVVPPPPDPHEQVAIPWRRQWKIVAVSHGSTLTSTSGGPVTSGSVAYDAHSQSQDSTTPTVQQVWPRYRTMEMVGNGSTQFWDLPSEPKCMTNVQIVSGGYVTEGDVYYALTDQGMWSYVSGNQGFMRRSTPLQSGAKAYFTYEEA